MTTNPTVALIGTLDTKGPEIDYARLRLIQLGVDVVVIDSGIMGQPQAVADITRESLATYCGKTLREIQNSGSRGNAVELMQEALGNAVRSLYDQKKIDGLLCFGGAEGALLGSAAARSLPIGVPKVLVTPVASGRREFGPYVGETDTLIMHSVIDILGLNSVSRSVFDNAVAAVAGMVKFAGKPPQSDKPCVGITMLGQTTPAVMVIARDLEDAGFEPIIFHANGVGGPAMDSLVRDGRLSGVIEFTISELANTPFAGIHATDDSRMRAAVDKGVPLIVVPGAADFFNQGPVEELAVEYQSRPHYRHNPVATLVRINARESEKLGGLLAERISGGNGPIKVIAPEGGFSLIGVPGGAIHDTKADKALIDAVEKSLPKGIALERVTAEINDEEFAHHVAQEFLEMYSKNETKV